MTVAWRLAGHQSAGELMCDSLCHLWGVFLAVGFWFGWSGFIPSPSKLFYFDLQVFLTFALSINSLVLLGWGVNKQLGGNLAASLVQATTSVVTVKM